ncbi:MAG: aminoacetone oxidase family FAD-binding enzyme [Clostridia bacterium]|nr:aminoacetone oxidase family FAD-binding enzyme [Clostridia bacterium]
MTHTNNQQAYDVIIIGAGASGLFYAAADSSCKGRRGIILEKTGRAGQKLLVSGNGACNITHGGSIKEFINKYGDAGSRIRSCLYRHNNLELMHFLEKGGVSLTEREDGKIFPASMKASDILKLLLHKAKENNYEIRLKSEVVGINTDDLIFVRLSDGEELTAEKLIIATGGASYPATGSDGSFTEVLKRDLGLQVTELKPALAPVYVQNYPFSDISGVSLADVEISAGGHSVRGPLLFTHRGFSGPAALHLSQHVKPGAILHLNFLPDRNIPDVFRQLKDEQPSNSKGIANYLSQSFGLPKALTEKMFADPTRKSSSIGHKELETVAHLMMDRQFSVSGTGGWNEAMVTAGGVALNEMNLKDMSLKDYPNIRVVGEALDINGDTGGYNLQFAYSSACAAQEI